MKQDVLDGMERWTPDTGAPQGAVLSPLLSNIYLDPLDHLVASKGFAMVRYADDFVIMCRSHAEAEQLVQSWTSQNGLQIHPEKTCIADLTVPDAGFDFLGYRFQRTRAGRLRWPSDNAMRNLRNTLRPITKRCNGRSLPDIIEELNPVLRGWFEYFKHGNKYAMKVHDCWLRMRLRSILRRRHKGQGRGRGLDHFHWPNAYFHELGLFSLEQTYLETLQSLRGTR